MGSPRVPSCKEPQIIVFACSLQYFIINISCVRFVFELRNAEKKKKTKNFLEDIGNVEFDELSVSRTGRLVEENKRLELDFSGFLGCTSEESEDVPGRSSDTHGRGTRDFEGDHLCDNTSFFEEESEEGESLSSHNKRKLRLLSSWRKEREYLIRAYRKSNHVPHTAVCCSCLSDNPEFRCKDCGPYSFFCCKCLVQVHNTKNYFHSPEKWQVYCIL